MEFVIVDGGVGALVVQRLIGSIATHTKRQHQIAKFIEQFLVFALKNDEEGTDDNNYWLMMIMSWP